MVPPEGTFQIKAVALVGILLNEYLNTLLGQVFETVAAVIAPGADTFVLVTDNELAALFPQ